MRDIVSAGTCTAHDFIVMRYLCLLAHVLSMNLFSSAIYACRYKLNMDPNDSKEPIVNLFMSVGTSSPWIQTLSRS